MPVIVVEVMPKAELLDPAGKAVAGAIARLGHGRVSGVRLGKRFELTVDGPVDEALLEEVRGIAEAREHRDRGRRERPRGRAGRRRGADGPDRGRHLPGSLDDRDAQRAIRPATPSPSRSGADRGLSGVDAIVLPGGFSYGDYLCCGAIAHAPIMADVIDAANGGCRCSASAT